MKEHSDHGSLQPWQIFSALFVVFWATSAYFDHFMMTFVFCIAFGVLGEVVTSYLYGKPAIPQTESFSELTRMAQREHSRVEEQVMEQKMVSNEAIWRKDEALNEEEAEDDEGPPPLPAKDYGNDESKSLEMQLCQRNLSQALEELTEKDVVKIEDDIDEDEEEEDDEEPNKCKEDNKTEDVKTNIEATNSDQADQFLYKPSDFEDLLAKKYSLPVDEDETQLSPKKIYAPDSSDDDEELQEEYANREVDFNESESEEEEFVPKRINTKISDSDTDSSKEEKEEIDIDLTDPKVQEAAAKIQTVFKGFQVRKKIQKGGLR